jgi:hypothetical protein
MGIEDPEADVAEQQLPAVPPEDDDTVTDPDELPVEADPADVAEQRTVVPEDDAWERG